MPGTIHPYFWIRRNADTYVPLIAIDELPDSISLEGISITKKWEDVCQGEMRFLGDHFDHNGQHYVVEFLKPASDAAPSPPKVFRAPDVKDIGLSDVRGKGVIGRQDADQIQTSIDHITASQEQSPEGSQDDSQDDSRYLASAGTLGKKVYCTYWIRTGNCNYMQEGCKYKHEIPPDDETRLAIGVRTYPSWPREDPTPPPRPVKTSQGPKPAYQQSWRRQEARDPQGDSPGVQTGIGRPDVPSTLAYNPTRSQSDSSQPRQNGYKPLRFTSIANAPQPATNTDKGSQKQSHGQASASSSVTVKGSLQTAAPTATQSFQRQSAHTVSHAPFNHSTSLGAHAREFIPSNYPSMSPFAHTLQASKQNTQTTVPPHSNGIAHTQRASYNSHAQMNSVGSSNDSWAFRFAQTPRDQNNDHANFGTKGSVHTHNPSTETVPQNNAPPYMPTHIMSGQSEDTQKPYPATLSYDNHAFATSGSARGNTFPITHGKDTATSSSRVDTPTTTNSNAARLSENSSSVDHNNVHAAIGSDIRAHSHMNSLLDSKLKRDAPNFFDGNGSVRAQTPTSVNGSVFGKFNARFENPFSPVLPSPQLYHRRLFREPGQAEYVANTIEDEQTKPQRTIKKHTSGSVQGKGKPQVTKGHHAAKNPSHSHGRTQAHPQT